MNNESIIRDVRDMTCFKRMAITRTAIERDPSEYLGNKIYEQIKAVAKAAEDLGLDWSLVHITLQVWDKRYLQALEDHEEKRIQEVEA